MLTPHIEGSVSIRSPSEPFLRAFRERVAAGLLTGRPHPRSNYVVSGAGRDHLVVLAADWWSAFNVGLNRLELRCVAPNAIHYDVRYWRWTAYAVALCGALGVAGVAMLLTLDVRGYVARNMHTMVPGLSVDQNVRVAWAMALFWGFIWPWLLVALHRRPLRALVKRLVEDVDARLMPR